MKITGISSDLHTAISMPRELKYMDFIHMQLRTVTAVIHVCSLLMPGQNSSKP